VGRSKAKKTASTSNDTFGALQERELIMPKEGKQISYSEVEGGVPIRGREPPVGGGCRGERPGCVVLVLRAGGGWRSRGGRGLARCGGLGAVGSGGGGRLGPGGFGVEGGWGRIVVAEAP